MDHCSPKHLFGVTSFSFPRTSCLDHGPFGRRRLPTLGRDDKRQTIRHVRRRTTNGTKDVLRTLEHRLPSGIGDGFKCLRSLYLTARRVRHPPLVHPRVGKSTRLHLNTKYVCLFDGRRIHTVVRRELGRHGRGVPRIYRIGGPVGEMGGCGSRTFLKSVG